MSLDLTGIRKEVKMTDEQKIIDGVDVRGCEFCDWKGSNIPQCRIRLASFETTCKGYNCYYKQLKHKEQECEELKSDLTDLSKTIDCKNETILTFKEQLAQFKAKNDKYSLFIEKLCDYAGLEYGSEEQAMKALSDLASQVNKDRYKQTLIKVKEIAETAAKGLYTTKSDDYTDGYKWLGSIILQKIKECGVE